MKKTREFHDNESENISGESELLCRFGTIYSVLPGYTKFLESAVRRLLTFLSHMRRLFEGGAYSNKYGMHNFGGTKIKYYGFFFLN